MKTKIFNLFALAAVLTAFNESSAQTAWNTTGNSGTTSISNFVGTTDFQDLIFKRYNTFSGRIGADITSFGFNSLLNNTTGTWNTAFGANNLGSNTSGHTNYAFGSNSLMNNTVGYSNIAFGDQVLKNNISGVFNNAVGNNSLYNNIVGFANTAFGESSLRNTTGNYNSAFGHQSLHNNVTGSSNVAFGVAAGFNLTAGDNNIFIGANTYPNISNIASNQLNVGNVITGSGMGSSNGGRIGIGLGQGIAPGNKLEIAHGIDGNSGLRFRNLTNAEISITNPTNKVLSVNSSGDVILVNDSQGTGGTTTITNALSSVTNTMSSTVNGVVATAPIVNTVQNTIAGGQLTTTVNGIASTPVGLPVAVDTDAQTLSISGNQLTISNGNTVVLPVGSGPSVNLYNTSSSIVPASFGNRVVTLNNNNLVFNTAGTNNARNRVYIGSNPAFPTTTGNYRLYVEGGILTEKVKVAIRNSVNWADYVFAEDYKLMPLSEVETFVKENKHLPGVASADELVKEGLDLSEMQAKQMEKIEELTLYAINQNKKIEKQEKEIEELKALVKLLIEKK